MMYPVIYQVYKGVVYFLNILSTLLIIYCVMTWVVRPETTIYRVFSRFFEPMLRPFRKVARKLINKGLMVDVSILLALIAIEALKWLLARVLLILR